MRIFKHKMRVVSVGQVACGLLLVLLALSTLAAAVWKERDRAARAEAAVASTAAFAAQLAAERCRAPDVPNERVLSWREPDAPIPSCYVLLVSDPEAARPTRPEGARPGRSAR